MNKSKGFSLLMSLYDKEIPHNLKNSLASIVTQTLAPNEIILIFDGPINSELVDVVHSFKELLKGLRIIKLDENVGLGSALNFGLQFCKYEYIARMDTDDICYPERFEKQIDYLYRNENVSVVGATVSEFNNSPGDLNRFRTLPEKSAEIFKFAKYRNPLNHPTVVFKKEHIILAGSYKPMPLFEDYYLWVRLLIEGYNIENLKEPLLYFRIGNDMIGRRHGFSYASKEFRFLKELKELKFITKLQFIISIMAKLPLRLLPKSLLNYFYLTFLR